MQKEKTYTSLQESLLRGFYIASICAAIPLMVLSLLFAETKAYHNFMIIFAGASVNTAFYIYYFKKKKEPLKFLYIFLITITITSYIFALDRLVQYAVIFVFYLLYLPLVYFFLLKAKEAFVFTFIHYFIVTLFIVLNSDYHGENSMFNDPMIISSLIVASVFILFFGFYYNKTVKDAYTSLELANEKNITLYTATSHRVKNNLNAISAIAELQANESKDNCTKDTLLKIRSRIESIATLDKALCAQKSFDKIAFYDYIFLSSHLTKEIYNADMISIKINVNNLSLPFEATKHLGLIITELLSNSFKYAFGEEKHGEIFIELFVENGKYIFQYYDSGTGIKDIEDLQKNETLGMEIIKLTTQQMDGVLSIENSSKLVYVIEFKI